VTSLPITRRRPAAWMIIVLSLALIVPAVYGAGAPLRGVDWNAALAADPQVRVRADVPQPPFMRLGPFITTSTGDAEVSGYAATADVQYGDLDGDGTEEAVIPVISGGTAGMTGFLLYREGEDRPRLVAAVPGYKLFVEIQDGVLAVHRPGYVGFEPNCCPSATVVTWYVLAGNTLTPVGEIERPNVQSQEVTVVAFYAALNERRFADAYAFLSPAYQASYPFDSWSAGFANTERITVDQARAELLPDAVVITVTAVDRLLSGGTVTRRFGGAWYLVWSPTAHRWLLDRAELIGAS
jgi:hypothetical protein